VGMECVSYDERRREALRQSFITYRTLKRRAGNRPISAVGQALSRTVAPSRRAQA
jgi:hypothetical protein